MRVTVRAQQVYRDLQGDDKTRKRLREVLDRMSAAKPGQTLADVIAGDYARARAAAGKQRFESLFKYGTHDPEQDRLFQKPAMETEALRAKIMELVPQRGQVLRPADEVPRITLSQATIELYPQWNNEDRRDLLDKAIEELIAEGKLDETSDMKYFRPPPKFKQSGMDEFS